MTGDGELDATATRQIDLGRVTLSRVTRDFFGFQLVVRQRRAMAFRSLTTAARKTLRIGLIPADGIGKEVIPVSGKR